MKMQAILFNQSFLLDNISNINIVITCGMKTLERLEKKSQCYIDRVKLQRNLSCSD